MKRNPLMVRSIGRYVTIGPRSSLIWKCDSRIFSLKLFRYREVTLIFNTSLEIPTLLTMIRISTLYKVFAIRYDKAKVPSPTV